MTTKRTGTIEKKRGRDWARVRDADGKRPRFPIPPGMTDEDERRAYVARLAASISKRSKAPAPPRVVTWAEWARAWFRRRESRKMTSARSDASRWATWCTALHLLDVKTIKRSDIEALVRRLDVAVEEERISWKTASNVWGVVSRMCRDMARSKVAELRVRDDNPAEGVEPPDTGDNAARVYLYPSEMPALLACPTVPLKWRVTYAIAAYTSLRTGELAALRWGDIDAAGVRVRRALDRPSGDTKTTKSGKTRNVPVELELAPLLDLVRGAPTALVIPVGLGQKGLGTRLRAHLLEAGVRRLSLHERGPGERPITFHDLRATALTWMALRGDSPQTIQQRAGHASYTTTQGYVREAESLGDVGPPFPPLPAAFLAAAAAPVPQPVPRSPKSSKTGAKLEPTMGFEGMARTDISETPETRGPVPVEDRQSEEPTSLRGGTGPGLARCPIGDPGGALLDLERLELADALSATGTWGRS